MEANANIEKRGRKGRKGVCVKKFEDNKQCIISRADL